EPWAVQRVLALWDKKESHLTLDNDKELAHLGDTVREFVAPALTLLGRTTAPLQRHYRQLSAHQGGAHLRHPMEGIGIGSDARRPAKPEDKPAPELLKALRARSNLMRLAENLQDPGATLAQIKPLLATLPEEQAAAAALAIGRDYVRRGHWALAREAFMLMVETFPTHPLALDAYRWLVQHNASSEARRRHELGQFLMKTTTGVVKNPLSPKDLGGSENIKQTALTETIANSKIVHAQALHWYKGSL